MEFTAEKDEGTIPFVLSQILDTCVNGITLSDPDQPDNPIVYANEAFELITGYDREEILGRNCRFLQGEDRDQPEIERIREALRDQKLSPSPCATTGRTAPCSTTSSPSAPCSTARAGWSTTWGFSTTSPRRPGRKRSCAGSTPAWLPWASAWTQGLAPADQAGHQGPQVS